MSSPSSTLVVFGLPTTTRFEWVSRGLSELRGPPDARRQTPPSGGRGKLELYLKAASGLAGDPTPVSRSESFLKTAKGWIVAIPIGIALRGVIKGYVPPVSFAVVTMIATLVIVGGARVLFAFAEDFFVEMVN